MLRTTLGLTLALAGAIVIATLTIHSVGAQEQVKKLTLVKTDLAGVSGKQVTLIYEEVPPAPASLKKNEYPAGSKHYHTGHAIVYMIDGSLVLDYEGQPTRTVGPGDFFEELPGQVLQGKNASTTEWAKIIVFQVGEKGAPLDVKVK